MVGAEGVATPFWSLGGATGTVQNGSDNQYDAKGRRSECHFSPDKASERRTFPRPRSARVTCGRGRGVEKRPKKAQKGSKSE